MKKEKLDIDKILESLDRLAKSQENTDKQISKLMLSQEKTDKQIKELRKAQEQTDRQLKETDRKLSEIGRQLGDIGLVQGDFAEEMFFSSLLKKPVLGDIRFDTVEANVGGEFNDFEFDIVMRNGTSIGLIEVKYKARSKDIEKITEEKVQNFRKSFPQYKDKKLYFGIATTVSGRGLIAKAKKCGIFLLGQQGNHVELMNKEVKPF